MGEISILVKIKYLIAKVLIKLLNPPAIRNSQVDRTSQVASGSHIVNSYMKRYSYIGNYSTIINTEIGAFCSVADYCLIGGAAHPLKWVSTSPVFHSGKNILNKNFATHDFIITQRTIIGNDVWIGSRAIIKSGVRIGDGAIVGMGSVVTKDVEPYAIVAGNPARLIRRRFDDQTINALLESRWWEWDDDKIKANAVYFNDVQEFVKERTL